MTLMLQAAPAGSGSGPAPVGADAEMRDLLLARSRPCGPSRSR